MRSTRLLGLLASFGCALPVLAQDCSHRWSHVNIGPGLVNVIGSFDWLGRPVLMVGGYFDQIDGVPVSSAALWNGDAWDDLRGGFVHKGGAVVSAFVRFDDHSDSAIYAGGIFSIAGSVEVSCIARWDGQSWSDVGGGLTGVPPIWTARVNYLTVWDDGTGAALYAGGRFDTAGDTSAYGIARWDGQSWSDVGGGVNGGVASMKSWDDGTGVALYCGGVFTRAGDQAVSNLAKWDGQSWSDVGGGVSGPDAYVAALEVWDDGSGEQLYVGGDFYRAGGQSGFNHIARWDGHSWDSMSGGFVNNDPVNAFCIFDNGNGPALYAGGTFVLYKNQKPSYGCSVVRWDGQAREWVGQGKGPLSRVRTMASYPVDGKPTLWVGGSFTQIGEKKNLSGLAWHRGGSTEYPADLWRDGNLDRNDFYYFVNHPADRNDDGLIDLFDYLDFINTYNAGCP